MNKTGGEAIEDYRAMNKTGGEAMKTNPGVTIKAQSSTERFHGIFRIDNVCVGNAAAFALDMMRVSAFGAVPCDVDPTVMRGPHPDNFQPYRLLAPEELADRCIAIAGHAFKRFEELGWTSPAPTLEEMRDENSQKAGFSP